MKYFFAFLLFIFLFSGCNNHKNHQKSTKTLKKEYFLKTKVANLISRKIILTTMFGHNQVVVDSAYINVNGMATFRFTDKSLAGMYRLMLGKDTKAEFFGGQETYIDVIFNYEDIELSTDFNNVTDSMKVSLSEENKEYYNFLKNETKANLQLDILEQLVQFFPVKDNFYPKIKAQFALVGSKQKALTRQLLARYPETFATKIIKSKLLPEVSFELPFEKKNTFLKTHYFDKVDFSDTMLLYTNVFSTKSVDYIKLFHNTNLNKPSQDKEFFSAVDTLMTKSKKNSKVYNYMRSYLLTGFEKLDNEEVLTYIVEKYPETNRCEDDKQTKNIKKRIEGSKKLAIGSIAPEINVKDIDGNSQKLQNIKTDYILLIFWASWCPHCQQMLPEIKRIYDQQNPKKFEVITISIDTIKSAWADFLKKGKFSWISCSDLKGWNAKVAQDYYLYATPTMFLLDKNRKILAKPIRLDELYTSLSHIK